MKSTTRNPLLAVVLALATFAAACGGGGAAFDDIRASGAGSDRERPYDSVQGLAELIDTGRMPNNPAVVVGEITAVEKGIGAAWLATGNGETIVLPFGDPESQGNTANFTVNVIETLAGQPSEKQITVGVFFGPQTTFDEIKKDFGSLDRVVFFLYEAGTFAYLPGVHVGIEEGGLFGIVDDNDRVTFPLVDGLAIASPGTKSVEASDSLTLNELRPDR